LVREATEEGAAFLPQTEAALGAREGTAREVILRQPGRHAVVSAGVILAADGLCGRLASRRASILACPQSSRASKDACPTKEGASGMGAGVIAELAPPFYSEQVIYLGCARAGYVGLVRLEDGRLDVAAAFDREAVRDAGGPGNAAARVL